MRHLALIILLFSVQLLSGQRLSDYSVSLDSGLLTVEQILVSIEAQTPFSFSFNPVQIPLDLAIHPVTGSTNLGAVLMDVSKEADIVFRRIDQQIVIRKLKPTDLRRIMDEASEAFVISGIVEDWSGGRLEGVTVICVGAGRELLAGTATSDSGYYSMIIPVGAAFLRFSCIGYTESEVPVLGDPTINIVLEEEIQVLDEIIVIGYGGVRRQDLTGSVATVSSEDLSVYPASDVLQSIQGLSPGTLILRTNGDPASDYRISIRGNTSINASSEPLIVVDGFAGASLPPPEFIESIQVLKDASSAAIYGSRGANGVVVITTKSGKKGKFQVDLNSSYSVQEEINRLEVLDATNFADYINEIEPGFYPGSTDYSTGTNWQDEVYRRGIFQKHQLAMSGGNDRILFYLSGSFHGHKGIIIDSEMHKYSLTSNVESQVVKWLKAGASILANRTNHQGVNSQRAPSSSRGGVPDGAYKFSPKLGIYNEDGSFTISDRGLPYDNPYATATAIEKETNVDLFQGNVYLELDLIRGLKFKSALGFRSYNLRFGQYYPGTLYRARGDGEAALLFSKSFDLSSENYFMYSGQINEIHNIGVMAGYSYQSFSTESLGLNHATGFPSDAFTFWNISLANNPSIETGIVESELSSIYGRLTYGYQSKYLVTFNARYDGSSRFAVNNKWGFFPSGAVAWNIAREGFMSNVEEISQLKVRISYGITGNQAILPYQSQATLTTVFVSERGNIISGIVPGVHGNRDLSWESTAQTNIGIDLGLWNNRLGIIADYYNMITSDLLFNAPVPGFTGATTQIQNVGEVQNQGFEFAVSPEIHSGAFKWNMSANISFNRNTILKLVENDTEGNDIIYSTAPIEGAAGVETQILREGEPVGLFYGYIYDGVLQEGETPLANGEGVGGQKFLDLSGDTILNADDRTIIGNPHPDFIWGWNNYISYRNFDLNIFIQGSQGGEILNYTRMELGIMNGRHNATMDALDRWTPENTDTDIPKADRFRKHVASDRWIEDASYIRLKNISLGYNFDPSLLDRIGIRSARIYMSLQNFLTITKYQGVDPEVAYSYTNKNVGLDYASYPNVKSMTFGVKLGF